MSTLRSKLVTAAAVAAAGAGGVGIANAATSDGTATTTTTPAVAQSGAQGAPNQGPPQRQGGRHSVGGRTEQALSGGTASKVQKAALARVSGTVERVETNVDGSAPYEAHIRKSDGSEVEVQVSKDFTVVAVNDMGAMGGRRP